MLWIYKSSYEYYEYKNPSTIAYFIINFFLPKQQLTSSVYRNQDGKHGNIVSSKHHRKTAGWQTNQEKDMEFIENDKSQPSSECTVVDVQDCS